MLSLLHGMIARRHHARLPSLLLLVFAAGCWGISAVSLVGCSRRAPAPAEEATGPGADGSPNRPRLAPGESISPAKPGGALPRSQPPPLPAPPAMRGVWFPVKFDGAFGYVDDNADVVLEPRWSGARFFSEGLAAVRKGEKWGFIDTAGRQVIPARYEAAGDFSEGLARVKRDGQWGYIDAAGKEVLPFILDSAGDYRGGLANVSRDGQWWFADRKGEPAAGGRVFSAARSFSADGLAAVNVGGWEGDDGKFFGGLWGFIDKEGREAIPLRYTDARDFHDGLAAVRGAEERWGYVNVAGTEVIPLALLNVGDFSDGRAPTIHDEGWGFIDASGRWAILADYPGVTRFAGGRALVSRGVNGPPVWGFIDTDGKPVGPIRFDAPGDGFE